MTTTPPGRHRARALALALSGLYATGAAAQNAELDLARQQPVRIGEAALFPSLRIDYLVDDNVGLRSSDEVDASAVVVSPRLDFVADRRQLELRVSYLGEFSQGSEDPLDWADHRLGLDVDAEFDARRRASLAAFAARRHQELGAELTRGQAGLFDEPVRFNQTGFEASFTYGAVNARGNLTAGLRAGDVSYVNLSSVTDGRDYTRLEPFGQFSYRLGGDTRAVLELGVASFDFDRSLDDRDELALQGGLQFSATGKLRGGFLLGITNASYSADGVEDETAFTTRANLTWLPREYSTLRLDLERAFDNLTAVSAGAGEAQSVRTLARLGWNHQWSERFRTAAFAQLVDVDRACPQTPTSTGSAGLELTLAVRRWLEFGASGTFASRGADDCPGGPATAADTLDYDQSVLGAHVRVTL